MRISLLLVGCLLAVLQFEETRGAESEVYEKKFVSPPPSYSKFGRDGKWRQKKPTHYLKKKFRTLEKEEYRRKKLMAKSDIKFGKEKKKVSLKNQKYLKNEKYQLCQSLSEDSVKDTLIKFGVVTHIIPDLVKFRTTMKSLKDAVPPSKKKYTGFKKDKKASKKMQKEIRLSQTNYVGRSMGGLVPPQLEEFEIYEDGSNNNVDGEALSREKRAATYNDVHKNKHKGKNYQKYKSKGLRFKDRIRDSVVLKNARDRQGRQSFAADTVKDKRRKGTSKNFDQVPQCYGWRYLSALNAITTDDTVDVDTLSQAVSDMLDIQFADVVANIIETCGEMLDKPTGLCPPMEDPIPGQTKCESQCQLDSDCGYKELCCRQQCSNKCVSILGSNYNKCGLGDQFMQCLYNMIDTQLCDAK